MKAGQNVHVQEQSALEYQLVEGGQLWGQGEDSCIPAPPG